MCLEISNPTNFAPVLSTLIFRSICRQGTTERFLVHHHMSHSQCRDWKGEETYLPAQINKPDRMKSIIEFSVRDGETVGNHKTVMSLWLRWYVQPTAKVTPQECNIYNWGWRQDGFDRDKNFQSKMVSESYKWNMRTEY